MVIRNFSSERREGLSSGGKENQEEDQKPQNHISLYPILAIFSFNGALSPLSGPPPRRGEEWVG